MRLTISRKLLFGYVFMALLTVLVSAYAIYHLQKLNQAAYDITHRQFIIGKTAKNMLDALIAEESTEKKYFVFRDDSLEQLFWQHAGDFKAGLELIKKLNPGNQKDTIFNRLKFLHERYISFFSREVTL